MTVGAVYLIRPSYDNDRVPYVTRSKVAPNDQGVSLDSLTSMLNGKTMPTNYQPVTLLPSHKIGELDFYGGGSIGLYSQKAVDVLGPFMTPCFEFVQVLVRKKPWFFIRAIAPIDALDRSRSTMLRSEEDPDRILMVESFALVKERLFDPLIFTVPEVRNKYLLGTDSIPTIIERGDLRGFRFVNAEVENALYK